MIIAAWSILTSDEALLRGRITLRIVGGIASASAAIAIKQSAAFEALFFGLWIAFRLLRSPAPLMRATVQICFLASLALLPWLITVTFYAARGHFDTLWQALVTSNSARLYFPVQERLLRLVVLPGQLILPLVFACRGWRTLFYRHEQRTEATFLGIWASVALLAIFIFPNIYKYYALTALAPLCILSAIGFFEDSFGKFAWIAMLALALVMGGTLDLPTRIEARTEANALSAYVKRVTPPGRLFVFGMPLYLYLENDTPAPGPLAFPPHLYERNEAGASGLDEVAHVRTVLARMPATVVLQDLSRVTPLNQPSVTAVRRYVQNCRHKRRFATLNRDGTSYQDVYSGCGAADRD